MLAIYPLSCIATGVQPIDNAILIVAIYSDIDVARIVSERNATAQRRLEAVMDGVVLFLIVPELF